jgi:hypothetical protein
MKRIGLNSSTPDGSLLWGFLVVFSFSRRRCCELDEATSAIAPQGWT